MTLPKLRSTVWLLIVAVAADTAASPFVDAGDTGARHDVLSLADSGVISGPVSSWPLAWGPILEELDKVDIANLPPAVADAVLRLQSRGRLETQTGTLGLQAELAVAGDPTRIRSFKDTPRGDAEVSAGATWLGNRFSAELNVQYVEGDPQGDEYRADGSMIGISLGNWSISANTLERWWGPGWDGSLILSNNARPIPSLTIDRIFTNGFESKWLQWLGPWDLIATWGQLESAREIKDAQFFGMRVNFRPLKSLEIGLSRTAIWCGDARPCGGDTFVDLLLGRDNVGDAGIGTANEPGNQLAGIDVRWSPGFAGLPFAVYGQFIGEDEAGGFPSRYLGQVGGEWSGILFERWSARAFAEFAGTSCQFHESSERFNCGYNHATYETGYRYRNRPVGHGVDNDARVISAGIVLIDSAGEEWHVLLRSGTLNRGGAPDPRNTLTPTPQDISSIDVNYSRPLQSGKFDAGVGYETIDDIASNASTSGTRFFLQWQHLF